MAGSKYAPPCADRDTYKSATDRVVGYLITVARCHGNITAHLHPDGRAKVGHLPKLASKVSGWVPDKIFEDIRTAIDGRETSLRYHTELVLSTQKAIADHQHMIDMLKEVRGILGPHRRPRLHDQPKRAQTPLRRPEKDVGKRFSRLALCEPSSTPLGEAPFEMATLRDADRSAVLELLGRFWKVQSYLFSVWKSLLEGQGSILTCAALTNAAYALMQDFENSLTSQRPHLRSWHQLQGLFGVQVRHGYKTAFLCPLRSGTGPTDDEVALMRPTAATMLIDIFEKVRVSQQTTLKPPSVMVFENSCSDFGAILRNQIEHIRAQVDLCAGKGDGKEGINHLSPFNKGLLEYIETSKLPLWLVHAADIECFIHEMLGCEAGLGSDIYLNAVAQMAHRFPLDLPSLSSLDGLRSLAMQAQSAQRDIMEPSYQLVAIIKKVQCPTALAGALPGKAIAHFTETPTAAMDNLFNALLDKARADCREANRTSTVIALAHVYKEGKKLGLFRSRWGDMETFIDRHGQQMLLRTDNMHSSHTPLKRFLQALEVPPWELGPTGHPSQRQIAKRCKTVKPTCECLKLLQTTSNDPSNIGTIAKALAKQRTRNTTTATKVAGYSIIETLESLRSYIEADEPVFNFNYVAFIDQCREIGKHIGFKWNDPDFARDDMCVRIAHKSLDSLDTAKCEGRQIENTALWMACKEIEDLVRTGKFGIGGQLTKDAKVSLGKEECQKLRVFDCDYTFEAFEAYLGERGDGMARFSAEVIGAVPAGLVFWVPKEEEIDELAELGEQFWQEWEANVTLRDECVIEK
ncbi:hypothetical protein CKM354_001250700 [Cercospora kikuchii]|uniref:DUF6604 domain-containing protein n=1 Tax=Cercospora kikuchii TaxID=84275 RepID=A0A9P3FM43_9PEZI|nr:uncharacterized protein CKM354_001250700 [Cercospora kikuchii]GIZ49477.1 hypothetical protein CKM354_001250700 [Cercospora kikuchii]